MKKLLIIILCLFLSGCWVTPEIPEPDITVYRALLVGVGDYLYFGFPVDLTSPAPNTEKLEEVFSQCRFGEEETEFEVIKRLTDLEATKENILNGILETFAGADDNDISYLYYMGHGGVKDGIPVITPSDTKFTLETDITVHELEATLNMIPGTKVIFLETCHAGNFIDKSKGNFNSKVIEIFALSPLDLLNKESYQVLTSSKGDQLTWQSGDTSYFCMGLYEGFLGLKADTNEDRVVDLSEAYIYAKEWVNDHTTKDQDVQIYPDDSIFPIVEY